MRESVKPAFIRITEAWEGPATINWMFPDVEGYVSTGMGLLLEPVALATSLPWRRLDGSLAGRDEIVADFFNVKNHPNAPRLGHRSVKDIARLRINPEDIHAFVLSKVASNEAILRQGFPDFDEWPADAQLAAHSLAWACGPSYWSPKAGRCYFPKLTAALRERNFADAALECKMDETGNPGLVPRNRGNKIMFLNATLVHDLSMDPEALHYPRDLTREPVGDDDTTQRNPDWATVTKLPFSENDEDDEPPTAA